MIDVHTKHPLTLTERLFLAAMLRQARGRVLKPGDAMALDYAAFIAAGIEFDTAPIRVDYVAASQLDALTTSVLAYQRMTRGGGFAQEAHALGMLRRLRNAARRAERRRVEELPGDGQPGVDG